MTDFPTGKYFAAAIDTYLAAPPSVARLAPLVLSDLDAPLHVDERLLTATARRCQSQAREKPPHLGCQLLELIDKVLRSGLVFRSHGILAPRQRHALEVLLRPAVTHLRRYSRQRAPDSTKHNGLAPQREDVQTGKICKLLAKT